MFPAEIFPRLRMTPTVNRSCQHWLGCLRTLRGRGVIALLAIGIAWSAFAPAAGALQLQAAAGLQTREAASRELAAARTEVQAAQAECGRTRAALDEFLANHLDAQREADAEQSQTDAEREQQAKLREELKSQLAELQAKRVALLQTLTEEHPEVIDITSQVEALEARVKTSDEQDPAGENPSRGQSKASLDAAEYRRLLGDWRTAERRLDSARQAESAAADQLHAVTELLLHRPAQGASTATPPADPAAAPLAGESHDAPHPREADSAVAIPAGEAQNVRASRTQTLALASLALAVMLAALAAVRLARATADPLFSSADEVSAALAVPVVGLIPFGAKTAAASDSGIRRGAVLLAQVVLALALFSAVAYGVVHFDALIRFFSNPVETLRSWFGL